MQAAGVNAFLAAVFGPDTRISTLLADTSLTPQQVDTIRRKHLEEFLPLFVGQIRAMMMRYADGERRFHVLARRFGLDGEAPASLSALAVQHHISLERVRRIGQASMRRCRFTKSRAHWHNAAYMIAIDLLRDAPPARDAQPDEWVEDAARMLIGDGRPPIAPTDDPAHLRARTMELVDLIVAETGEDISTGTLADLLSGSRRPVSVALAGHFNLHFAHGALAMLDRATVRNLVWQVRTGERMASQARRGETQPDEPDQEQVRLLARGLQEAVGRKLSPRLVAYILYGSRGPVVDGLVAQHSIPQHRALHALGYARVEQLVYAAQAAGRLQEGDPTVIATGMANAAAHPL